MQNYFNGISAILKRISKDRP